MAKQKVLLRRKDGSGSGFLFTHDDANAFLEYEDNAKHYVRESAQETEATQRAADEEVKAAAEAEKKARK